MELLEELRQIEETQLIELLEVTSDEIVDAFLDKIVEHKGRLIRYIDEQN